MEDGGVDDRDVHIPQLIYKRQQFVGMGIDGKATGEHDPIQLDDFSDLANGFPVFGPDADGFDLSGVF